MGNTTIDSNLRAKIYAKDLWADVKDNIYFQQQGLMGSSEESSVIWTIDDLKKSKGDTITMPFTAKLTGAGVSGDSELEGNEERILSYFDSTVIDQKRFGVRLNGRLEEQRAAYNMREDAKNKLKIRMSEFIERQIFLKLGGVTNTSVVDVNGVAYAADAAWANSPAAIPDADTASGNGTRYLCSNTGGADALTTSDKFTAALITKAKTKAMLAYPKVQPLRINGKNHYVMFIHPWQSADLKTDTAWTAAQREGNLRGEDNPLFSGMLGMWDGVIIYEHEYVPYLKIATAGRNFNSVGSGTTYLTDAFRALLCGVKAGVFVQAENPNGWVEKSFDFDNEVGFATGLIGGIDKTVFNSKEYGVISVDTYATPL